MLTYDGKQIEATMIITIEKEPIKDENGNVGDLVDYNFRVVIDTDNSRYSRGIDFDDGYQQAAQDIQEIILGRVANHNWENDVKKLEKE